MELANLLSSNDMDGSYISCSDQTSSGRNNKRKIDDYDVDDCMKKIKYDEEYHPAASSQKTGSWSCTQCGKLFSSKSNLKVHLRVHTRIRPYHCKHCQYSCMHHSSIREHLAKIHPEFTHNAGSPGYVYNASVVPDPVEFNSLNFDKQAFINEAKQNNDKLSAHITSVIQHTTPPTPNQQQQQHHSYSILDTPVSISPTSSNNEEQLPIKRRRRVKKQQKQQVEVSTPTTETSIPVSKSSPFSIDSIINTPTTATKLTNIYPQLQSTFYQQQWNAAAWLYANQMLIKMMTIQKN